MSHCLVIIIVMSESPSSGLFARQPGSEDRESLIFLYQHPLINAHIGGEQLREVAARLATRIIEESALGKALYTLYTDKESGAVVGLTSLHWRARFQAVEVGVLINPDHHQQGICRWALLSSMQQAERFFNRPVSHCICFIDPHNLSANITAERLGFVRHDSAEAAAHKPGQNHYEFDMEQLNNDR